MGWINPFLQIILVQFILFLRSSSCKIPIRGKELNKFCLPNSSNDLCLFFCIYPSSKPVAQFLLKAQITLEKTVGVVGGRNRNTEGLSTEWILLVIISSGGSDTSDQTGAVGHASSQSGPRRIVKLLVILQSFKSGQLSCSCHSYVPQSLWFQFNTLPDLYMSETRLRTYNANWRGRG